MEERTPFSIRTNITLTDAHITGLGAIVKRRQEKNRGFFTRVYINTGLLLS